jgi:hypothetical protein
MSKVEAAHDPFFVMFGEAMWALLYAANNVAAVEHTMDFIKAHP